MTWYMIFVDALKWITAIWAAVIAWAVVGTAVIALIYAVGGLLTGAGKEEKPSMEASRHLAACGE
jgi:hypothetical protein